MVMKKLEETFGLPSLSKVVESFEKLPDEKKLKSIKEILTIAERVSHTALELDKVVSLLKEINSMPMEKLEKLEKVLKRIEGIMKKAPEELMGFLASLKEE